MLLAPFLSNSLITYNEDIQMLGTIVQGRMLMVGKEGREIDLAEAFTLAVPGNMYGAEQRMRKMFPQAEFVPCLSHQEGLQKVAEGTADLTLVNEITGTYQMQSPYFESLKIISTEDILEDITLGIGATSDPLLISILSKGISSFSERDVRQIVVDNTVSHPYKMNAREWIYKNRYAAVMLVVICLAGIALMVYGVKVRRKEEKENERERLAQERSRMDREYQEKIFYQANFDSLTGLYNKDYFVEKTNEMLRNNPKVVYALLRLNIEKFKMINEIYGQKRGDMVLVRIAEQLRRSIGNEGVYGRMYSDHFLICYPIDEKALRATATNTVGILKCDGQDIRVEVEIGVYFNTKHYTDVLQFIDYAQIALLNKEKSGNDHVHFYKSSYLDTLLLSQRITNEMENALQEGQFQVFFQPQYAFVTNKLVGAEALVRWFHPTAGMIPPSTFIPVFEQNQFIYKLDAFVCEQVCRQLAKWQREGRMIPVSINLSRIDLQNPELIPMLQANLEKYQVPIEYLHLEITESAYVENQKEMLGLIRKLQGMGFVVEMDDFGSGYSALNMLKDVPVDILKLDMKFFSGETHMDKGGRIIESVVNLAHSLGMLVIAEGVETEREANFLRAVNCRIVQGYLYGRPMPLAEFDELMKKSKFGEKAFDLEEESDRSNLYWKMEKYNVLLKQDGILLFDYDPFNDRAHFTVANPDGTLRETKVEHYAEKMAENERVHPDYRETLRQILLSKNNIKREIVYLADYYRTGVYEWVSATAYSYCRDGKFSRIIAIIRKMEK